MVRFSLRGLSVLILIASAGSLARAQAIGLTVDTRQTPQKILHIHETIPVQAGPLTLYYPKWIPGEHGPDGPISGLTGLHFTGDGKEIPWQRDLLDVFTFHVDVPAGVKTLAVAYDFIEPDGANASDKLLVLEWNAAILYPAGTPAQKLNVILWKD